MQTTHTRNCLYDKNILCHIHIRKTVTKDTYILIIHIIIVIFKHNILFVSVHNHFCEIKHFYIS